MAGRARSGVARVRYNFRGRVRQTRLVVHEAVRNALALGLRTPNRESPLETLCCLFANPLPR